MKLTFKEKLLHKKIMETSLDFVSLNKVMYLDTYVNKRGEVYPYDMTYTIFKHRFKNKLLCIVTIKTFILDNGKIIFNQDLDGKSWNIKFVYDLPKKKQYFTIFNKALRFACKRFYKDTKLKGYKDCLVDYVWLDNVDDVWVLKLDQTFKEFNKFDSKMLQAE